jgi:hypothetical protein
VAKNPRKRIPEFIEPFRVEPESKVTLPRDSIPRSRRASGRRRRGRVGFHSAAPLIALIYLCCGGITIDLPLR